MSTTPERYQPRKRLVDDPERLRSLYCERGLTLRQIAARSSVSHSTVHRKLVEYDILDDEDASDECDTDESCDGSGGGVSGPVGDSERGFDPPAWSRLTESQSSRSDT